VHVEGGVSDPTRLDVEIRFDRSSGLLSA
jgi:hypothetical protein